MHDKNRFTEDSVLRAMTGATKSSDADIDMDTSDSQVNDEFGEVEEFLVRKG